MKEKMLSKVIQAWDAIHCLLMILLSCASAAPIMRIGFGVVNGERYVLFVLLRYN